MDYLEYIEKNTIRCEASYRGGGIEIDLKDLLSPGYKMTAYQNYLGGGMLGKISNSYNFDKEELNEIDIAKINEFTDVLNRYFHTLTNHSNDEWEDETYEQNQLRKPESALQYEK